LLSYTTEVVLMAVAMAVLLQQYLHRQTHRLEQ